MLLPNASRNSGGIMRSELMQSVQRPTRLEVVSKQATKVTAISTRLEWRIEQFEKLMKLFKNGQNLISKQFSCPQAPSVLWELHVYPNGKRDEDGGNVSFFLRQVGLQRGEDPIMTEFQIYTLDANDCRISVCRDTKDFSNQQGRGKFQVHREKMLAALRNDGSLLLICEVEYLPPGSKIKVEQEEDEDAPDEGKPETNIKESLREMLNTELFSDCILQVGSVRISAHRCILGQHSAVFKSMFEQKTMLEAQNGVITITDSRPEYVRAMIEYIYTGSVNKETLENYAQGILAIADKYAILSLKEQAERYLASTINNKNITSLAVVADTYFANSLKKACTKFISSHHKTVIRSPEWKELKTARGALANELLESVLDDQSADSSEYGNTFDVDSTGIMGSSNISNSSYNSYTYGLASNPNHSAIDVSLGFQHGHHVQQLNGGLALGTIDDDRATPVRKRPLRRGKGF